MSAELTAALSKYVRETVERQVKEELANFSIKDTVGEKTKSVV